ncbi:MAG TPA: diheme cytochrome c-553 [Chitinophagaceae bacterium]|nr:diheme cytochrome c-553 [Chitinophagaceae bacterium]
MKKKLLTLTAISAVIAAVFVACQDSKANEKQKSIAMTEQEKIKRGEYLVSSIGCDDCHSPKKVTATGFEIIPELRLSGFNPAMASLKPSTDAVKSGWVLLASDLTTAVGAWGQSYAANLTSDGTGIGNWKEEQFIKAIREGKYKGLDNTRPLLPPMPWFVYKNLTDDDLKSIFAFLRSTKPVRNVVPEPIPFNKL